MENLTGRTLSIETPDGGHYETYVCGDSGTGRPALLIFTPIFGIDEDMKVIAKEWADQGYMVAVPDYYFRVKPGPLDRTDEGRKAGFARWEKLDVDQAIQDMAPLVSQLLGCKACNGRWGALGFCAGGELAFLAATRLAADVVAGFHATRIHRHLAERRPGRAAISLHYGDSDPLVPLSEVSQIQDRYKDDARVEIFVYPGATHGFSFPGRASYHESAATQSRTRVAKALSELRSPAHVVT